MTNYEDITYEIVAGRLYKNVDFVKANLEKKLNDLGADSLDMVEMTMDIEEKFDIKMLEDEMKERFKGSYPTTQQLVDYIGEKTGKKDE